MLSVILYGRNDLHGYHYHKRLAISINCIAEQLTDENDEIIFVDYNSPDDEPTVIEVIWDTLTDKALKTLRTIRVRSEIHQRIKTHLPACEPLARNIAIRRSNPKNKWILSTNTDMIFVPTDSTQTLSSIVADLEYGRYELPRFELPENFWGTTLGRSNPKQVLSFLRDEAVNLGLETIVRGGQHFLFDAPGDFQLIPRDMLFEVGGFDERMVLGWHCDSNLCKRLNIYDKQRSKSLDHLLSGFHCNHVKKITIFHYKQPVTNDWDTFINKVESPFISEQMDSWGLPEEELEEIRLPSKYKALLENILAKTKPNRTEFENLAIRKKTETHSISTFFSYLMDHLFTLPESECIACISLDGELPEKIKECLDACGKKNKVYSIEDIKQNLDLLNKSSIQIFDSRGAITHPSDVFNQVINYFLTSTAKKNKKTKYIGIDTYSSKLDVLFNIFLNIINNNPVSGISYGYISDKPNLEHHLLRGRIKLKLSYLAYRHCPQYAESITDAIRVPAFLKKYLSPN